MAEVFCEWFQRVEEKMRWVGLDGESQVVEIAWPVRLRVGKGERAGDGKS